MKLPPFVFLLLFAFSSSADLYFPAPQGQTYKEAIGLREDSGFLFYSISAMEREFLCRVSCPSFASEIPFFQRESCDQQGKGIPLIASIAKLKETEEGKTLYRLAKGGKVDRTHKLRTLEELTQTFLEAQADENFSFLESSSDCRSLEKHRGYDLKALTPRACEVSFKTRSRSGGFGTPGRKYSFSPTDTRSTTFAAQHEYIILHYSASECASHFTVTGGPTLQKDGSFLVTDWNGNLRIERKEAFRKIAPKD